MKILYLSKFAREYKKLPKEIQELSEKKEKFFRENPFDKKLKTHIGFTLSEIMIFMNRKRE